jgi:site-specific DNA-methyltransferase (adenine-specific)
LISEDLLQLAEENGKFDVIAIDCPWEFKAAKSGGNFKSGSAEHYPTMTLEEIKNLPIKQITTKNAVVFVWIPIALKEDIFCSGILKAWGLKYKTTLLWIKSDDPINTKVRPSMGAWFRGPGVEECLVCTRYAARAFHSQQSNLIFEKARKHSQKPEGFFMKIEPELEKSSLTNRLEIFARGRPRTGWKAVGNEVIL